jgi:phosphoesterase RecJ-like protein
MLKKPVSSIFKSPESLVNEMKRLQALIQGANTILISSTLTSDGDSIGGQLGLKEIVRQIGGDDKNVWIVDESPVPERYTFLSGSDQILSWEDFQKLKVKPSFDLGITCDGGVERTGVVAELFQGIPHKVLVDHHAVGSQKTYDATLLDLEVSSTCELVYLIFEELGLTVDASLAEALYVGIVFDTGFFKHSLTKPRTHHVAAQLIAHGINFSKISDRAILERTWEAQLLLRQLLGNMIRSDDGRVILSHWSAAELKEIGFKDGDQEGMINQLYYTDTAEVVALITELEPGDLKVSFRSKGQLNVAELARSLNPEGGGHVRAAGCSLRMQLFDARDLILKSVQSRLA